MIEAADVELLEDVECETIDSDEDNDHIDIEEEILEIEGELII